MKKLLLVTLFLFGVTEAVFADQYAGLVSVDSAIAHPGDTFSVAVRLNGGDVDLAGLAIPIDYGSSSISVDSVSFDGSVIPSGVIEYAVIDNANHKVRLSFYPDLNVTPFQSIPQSGGLLARMHFTASLSAMPGEVLIDTINKRDSVLAGPTYVYIESETLNAADADANGSLFPGFSAGLVSIEVSTGIGDGDQPNLPKGFNLAQNYPNPFNPATEISFSTGKRGNVKLEVFNVLGQSVATLINESFPAGEHSITFDASSHPSGIYFYRLTSSEGSMTRKMVLLK